MLSLVRSLHAWCGVGLSLFLVVIGLSGTVAVLRGEMVRVTTPAARAAPPPVESFGPALERYERDAGAPIRSVKFAPYDLGVHRLYLDRGAGAFIDADGAVAARWASNGRFDDWVLSLHHDLLAGQIGGRFVGLVGLAALGLVLSGLVVWAWPRPRAGFRPWPKSTARRDLLAAHWALGVVLSVFLLVQLTTGAGLALSEFVSPLIEPERPPPPRVEPVAGARPWATVLAAAQAAYPQANLRRATAPGEADAPFAVHLQPRLGLNPEGGTTVYLDGRGTVVGRQDITQQGFGVQVYDAFLGFHSGEYAGVASRIVAGLLGIGMAAMGLLGAWAFMIGPRMRRRARART